MALHVFNTLTRHKELFVPTRPPVVRIYTCGLTVYSPMHIGHARTYCFWDVFRRYLEYRGYYVMSVINYTDIDDRIMQAADEQRGEVDVAETVAASFRRDCRALRIRDYAAYTRATDFIQGQIDHVVRLVEAGHAYVVDGEVLYDVTSFPGYGQLSGRSLEGQQVGASGRVTEDVGRKRHPADFTLWKPSEPGQPSWPTGQAEWPSGRPGWHIECSTMSSATLGETFDVHGGAVDNMFPHHENEIAQSQPLCGSDRWVRYWLHPEHLDLRGEKMSKSLGNVIGIPELLEHHGADEVRWFFCMTHYRSRLAFNHELVSSAAEGFARIRRLVRTLEQRLVAALEQGSAGPGVAGTYATLRRPDEAAPRLRHRLVRGAYTELNQRLIDRFMAAMDDDLGCPLATAALFDYVGELYSAGIESQDDPVSLLAAYQTLVQHLWVLGIEYPSQQLFPELAAESFPVEQQAEAAAPYRAVIDRLLALRQQARADKDFARADLIRDMLAEAGLVVEDTPRGPRWELADRD